MIRYRAVRGEPNLEITDTVLGTLRYARFRDLSTDEQQVVRRTARNVHLLPPEVDT